MSTNMQSAEISASHSSVEVSLLGFPEKLWNLVNDPKCQEIVWSEDGKSLVIPNTQQFIVNVLNNPSKQIFKTKNFSSFVRQLNLYGFRKVTEHRGGKSAHSDGHPLSTKCKFKHQFFQTGRRDFLTKVKRNYQSSKKAKDSLKLPAAQPNVDRLLNQSCDAGGFLPQWNPVPVLYPTAPYFPAFAPQMPMSPFQPTLQFSEVLHGGAKDLSTVGLPCQWEYGPGIPFCATPLTLAEGNLKNTRETVALWPGITPVNPAQQNSSQVKPSLQNARSLESLTGALHNSTAGPSVSQAYDNSSHSAGITCSWPILTETKQPLPAQKTHDVLQKPSSNHLKLGNEEGNIRSFDEPAAKVSEEDFHWKKRKLSDSDPLTSSVNLH